MIFAKPTSFVAFISRSYKRSMTCYIVLNATRDLGIIDSQRQKWLHRRRKPSYLMLMSHCLQVRHLPRIIHQVPRAYARSATRQTRGAVCRRGRHRCWRSAAWILLQALPRNDERQLWTFQAVQPWIAYVPTEWQVKHPWEPPAVLHVLWQSCC